MTPRGRGEGSGASLSTAIGAMMNALQNEANVILSPVEMRAVLAWRSEIQALTLGVCLENVRWWMWQRPNGHEVTSRNLARALVSELQRTDAGYQEQLRVAALLQGGSNQPSKEGSR